MFRTLFLDSHFQTHPDSVTLQKYQLLSNQSFKPNFAHMPPLNLTPKLSYESRFRMFIINVTINVHKKANACSPWNFCCGLSWVWNYSLKDQQMWKQPRNLTHDWNQQTYSLWFFYLMTGINKHTACGFTICRIMMVRFTHNFLITKLSLKRLGVVKRIQIFPAWPKSTKLQLAAFLFYEIYA